MFFQFNRFENIEVLLGWGIFCSCQRSLRLLILNSAVDVRRKLDQISLNDHLVLMYVFHTPPISLRLCGFRASWPNVRFVQSGED